MLCRSFSELYQKAIKDAECKPGEDQSGEAWVLDEREDEEEDEEEEEEEVVARENDLKADGVDETDAMEVQVEAEEAEEAEEVEEVEEVEEMPCDDGQSERSLDSFLIPPSLPLLRATSLQDQPANQSQEGGASQLTRSFSLERQPDFRGTCDG